MKDIMFDETCCSKCRTDDPYNQPCGIYLNQLKECIKKMNSKRMKPESREKWRLSGIFIIRQLQNRGVLNTNYTKEQLYPTYE